MCILCSTCASCVVADALPGYNLLQAKFDTASWPKGWYGLVEQDAKGPVLVFPGPSQDPLFECDDAEMTPEMAAACDDFMSALACMRERLAISFTDAACLGLVCKEAGYRRETHGDIECWMLHKLSQQLAKVDLACADVH